MSNYRETLHRLSEAQNHRCAYCGVHMRVPGLKDQGYRQRDIKVRLSLKTWRGAHQYERYRRATLDHFLPRSEGGGNHPSNLLAACKWCNEYRSNQPAMLAFHCIEDLIRCGKHPYIAAERRGRFPHLAGLPSVNHKEAA